MHYPEYAHLGFKFLCSAWGFISINYMSATLEQRERKLAILSKNTTK
jgi:hypothetical protein